MCVLTGMDKTGLKQYGEALRSALTENPLTLTDSSVVAVDAKVGGVIADRDHPTNEAQLIIGKAYQALAEAGKRPLNSIMGSHAVKIVQVTDA